MADRGRRGAYLHPTRKQVICSFVLLSFHLNLARGQEPSEIEGGSILAWGTCGFYGCFPPLPNTDFVALAAGAGQILALTTEGTIVTRCPPPSYIRCQVPEPNNDFVAIAAGWFHGLGLKNDGSIVAWGHNVYGQCEVPAPNSGFVAVSANKYQSLALRNDGTVAIWGCGDEMPEVCALPSPNSGFVSISAGLYHNLGLRSDGTVAAWGCVASEHLGQCRLPEPNSDFIAVSAGYWHSLGLKSDGSIVEWGLCGPSSNLEAQCEVRQSSSGFVAIAAGGEHSLALSEDGSMEAWGLNDSGQCTVPGPNRGLRAIAAGGNNSFAIGDDCNRNALPDSIEIDRGFANDCNSNWVPEECEITPAVIDSNASLMNRYISMIPGNAGRRTAIRVRLSSLYHPIGGGAVDFSAFEGAVRWVGEPAEYSDISLTEGVFKAAALQCAPNFRDWGDVDVIQVFGSEIIPSSTYEIQIIQEGCSVLAEDNFSAITEAHTGRWGDVARPFWEPNGTIQPDMVDISQLIGKFQESPGGLARPAAQLQPRVVDPAELVNFLDISHGIEAFRGFQFPDQLGPVPCP